MNISIVKQADHCGLLSNMGGTHVSFMLFYSDLLRPEISHNINGPEQKFRVAIDKEISDKLMYTMKDLNHGEKPKPNYVVEFLGYIIANTDKLSDNSEIKDEDIKPFAQYFQESLASIVAALQTGETSTSEFSELFSEEDTHNTEIKISTIELSDKTYTGCKLSKGSQYVGFLLNKDKSELDQLIIGDESDLEKGKTRDIILDDSLREVLLKDLVVNGINESIKFILYLIDSKDLYFAEKITLKKVKQHVLGPPWNSWSLKRLN